jgi:hypothetical protein
MMSRNSKRKKMIRRLQRAKRRQRRGVLMLVVLSMLVLFVLVAVAFVINASQQHTAAKAVARVGQTGVDPARQIDEAFYQLVRGTRNRHSCIRGHSLLGDLYGVDGIKGVLSTNPTVMTGTGSQFIQIDLQPGAGFTLETTVGAYNGCVLTFLDGAARGVSTRVVGFDGATTVRVMTPNSPQLPAQGDQFMLNGRPFSGTGFGYETGSQNLGTQALLPNRSSYGTADGENLAANFIQGGADESWDAPDYQNMAMALVVTNSSGVVTAVIPSFHRPALINHLAPPTNTNHGAWMVPKELRNTIGTFDPVNNPTPWQVDNDGDGVPDSVWIDLGFPPQQAKDGTLYRPLFAFLCIDMDGKLNLNAHGTATQAANSSYNYSMTANFAGGGGAAHTPNLPLGEGYGPPEINLGALGISSTEFTDLLNSRYGADSLPGVSGADDPLSALKQFEYPANTSATVADTIYHLPPDPFGVNAVGVDYRGSPLVDTRLKALSTVDDPYEFDFSRRKARGISKAVDNPFSPAELERALRMFDIDAGQTPPRLAQLAPTLADRRHEITTDSWDLPSPGVALPAELRSGGWANSLVEILRRKLVSGGVANGAATNTEIAKMLPPEVINGLRMDLNRPFGNGRDDNGNGTPDDPAEATSSEVAWRGADGRNYPTGFAGAAFNHLNNNTSPISNTQQARQVFARQLYCLMMLLTDLQYNHPQHPNQDAVTKPTDAEFRARRIAQWAINVVDYRDADAIMTPFEYDVNPFNGWLAMDGNPGSDEGGERRLVWGVEDPHLVLTETFAFHDRRVIDGDRDKTMDMMAKDPAEDDDHLDQSRIPQGSTFLELLCTGSSANTLLPPELYSGGSLDLSRVPTGSTEPVWRLVITTPNRTRDDNNLLARLEVDTDPLYGGDIEPEATQLEPDNFYIEGGTGAAGKLEIERIVWFTTSGQLNPANSTVAGADRIYYRRIGGASVSPGQYAVVGPRPETIIGWNKNTNVESSAKIQLGSGAYNIDLYDGAGTKRYPASGIKSVVAMVAAADPPSTWSDTGNTAPNGIGLSISEPRPTATNYYPEPDMDNPQVAGLKDSYLAIKDEPLDQRANKPLNDATVRANGTKFNYTTVLLQRLANPTIAYNATTNPYITVDWMPIDLTTFNGEDSAPTDFDEATFGEPWDPDQANATATIFASRQRGKSGIATANIWSPVSDIGNSVAVGNAVFKEFPPEDTGHTLGYLNKDYGARWMSGTTYLGDPQTPFPWIAIANRPLVSQMELLNVPAASQGRLFYEFSTASSTPADPYDVNGGATDTEKYQRYRSPFGHLLNFRQTATPSPTPNNGTHFYRMLDYVHVPSRFVGTDDVLNPITSAFGGAGTGTEYYHPPFNRVSRFRDPGRVNINTIFSSRVWTGVLNGHQGPSLQKIVDSRRGYGSANTNMLTMDSTYPTFFTNPFRSAGASDLAPNANMRRAGVEATLLRTSTVDPGTPSTTPLFDNSSNSQANNSDRNSYFRYQTLNRMGNLVTTRSNVYAVWITMGYFEVDPGSGQLTGRELGADLGAIERHRGFYMIDRTIPVAFEPGMNHNVDDAVILRRFIE